MTRTRRPRRFDPGLAIANVIPGMPDAKVWAGSRVRLPSWPAYSGWR